MSWQMSKRMTSAPSSASLTAWLRPWPRPAPVTRTTLSWTRPTRAPNSATNTLLRVNHDGADHSIVCRLITQLRQHGDQLAAVNFHRSAAGQLVDDEHSHRNLVRGQRQPAVRPQLFFGRARTSAQFDCGHGDLAKPSVRKTTDSRIADSRMRPQRPHDGLGRHFESAAHDHVVGAAVDVQITFVVEVRQVAGGYPAVGG